MKKLTLVIPCYNEEENISLFYQECIKAFKKVKINTELIFINDGSKDNTILALKKLLAKKDFPIHIINFSRNFGKEAAIYAGLQKSSEINADYTVIIDADLQQKPELVLEMVHLAEENDDYDAICYYQEKRIENKLMSFSKKIFYKLISKISEIDFVDNASDFRLLKSHVVSTILAIHEKNRFSKGIFSWIGFNTCYIPYIPEKRIHGKSNFNFQNSLKYALSGIFSFSIAPLRIATYSGILFALISFIYLIVVIIQKIFFTIDVPGYATLLVCLLFIGGLILVCLGIIGEYIARIYIEAKDRPIYITKEYLKNEVKPQK